MPEPFKNLFNAALIEALGEQLHRRYPQFEKRRFIRLASADLAELELKQRAGQITSALEKCLPDDFSAACKILLAALHPEQAAPLKDLKMDDQGVRGWAVMPMADYVARRGQGHFDLSMQALAEMTKRFSSEFAVRSFINADLSAALKHIRIWAESPNEHLRRLASEGARPRLPWAQQIPSLIRDPSPMLPVLVSLRDDPSEYVRRSVANHLNDIAKDHRPLMARLVPEWLADADAQRRRLLRHACRTLIKQGDTHVLRAFGYTSAEVVRQKVVVEKFHISNWSPCVGESLGLKLHIRSTHTRVQELIVDYVIYWRRANGQWSPKVFKWKNLQLQPGQEVELIKKHSLKKITTRTFYPGTHKIAIQLNGSRGESLEFELVE